MSVPVLGEPEVTFQDPAASERLSPDSNSLLPASVMRTYGQMSGPELGLGCRGDKENPCPPGEFSLLEKDKHRDIQLTWDCDHFHWGWQRELGINSGA